MATLRNFPERETPLILLVPGTPLTAKHWMSRWAQWSEHCRVVELGLWDEPHRNTWVNKLNLAIRRADRPVVIVTDDIAALALAWWVEFEVSGAESPVIGALIVDAPNVDLPGADPRLAAFGACPRQPLPFT
ncbi:RBBP9/YdeN family alpha/beta hydrolase, partial [Novosphingobium sp. NRRL B-2648]